MYYNTTPSLFHPATTQRIQRSLTLDDYLQLQALLRHEQAQREREEARQEQLRLQQAMANLKYLTGQYRRERCRRIEQYLERQRREELLHQALLEQQRERALLQQQQYERVIIQEREQEEYYRQCLAAAIEQQRVDRLHQQYLASKEHARDQDNRRTAKCEPAQSERSSLQDFHTDRVSPLVNLIFGQQATQSESEEEESTSQQNDSEIWQYISRHQDTDMAENASEEEAHDDDDDDSSSSVSSQLPVEDHVLNLKGFVNELVANNKSVPESFEESATFESPQTTSATEDIQKTSKCNKLRKLDEELENIQNQHEGVFDKHLEFQKAEAGTLLLTASTANNREFLGYEDQVMRIMLQLDTIESDGDEEIRGERKTLVKRAEHILELLDAHKQSEWQSARRQQRADGKRKRKQNRRKQSKHKAHHKHHQYHPLVVATA
ncbi:hypothetical protein DFQ28_001719 [Apophysomyces sp. BC1034]|nr:hypothetical protein DFQ30_002440 [Apophysomyces sp. BC1015]KAG0180571.1 hypothetical protein DFQ29_000424 [Apophysomyces sp. BC1021]KAG0190659.1 hypothetical protein DFQ28_001719 [Apophysomyces sp. BC1034]